MLKFRFVSAILIICLKLFIVGASDSLPVQSFAWDDETVREIIREIDSVKASNEVLKSRLETVHALLDHHHNEFKHIIGDLQATARRNGFEGTNGGLRNSVQENLISRFPHNCAEALQNGKKSGIYSIKIDSLGSEPFLVYCDSEKHGGKWTVIQRRVDGSIDFVRKWSAYKMGFGNLEGEFFIGLDKLHAMTTEMSHELLIVMTDFDNVTKFAKYETFAIGNENEGYAMNVLGAYSGDAGDSLRYQEAQKFTTIDKDQDHKPTTNCAEEYQGAWWYNNCHHSNLNGLYLKDGNAKNKYAKGIHWFAWRGHEVSLKHVEMLIRPKDN